MITAILLIAIGIYIVIHLQRTKTLIDSYRQAHLVTFTDETTADEQMPDHLQRVAELLLDSGFHYLGAVGVVTAMHPDKRIQWIYAGDDDTIRARLMEGSQDRVNVAFTSSSPQGALALTTPSIDWRPFDNVPQPGIRKLETALVLHRRRAAAHKNLDRVGSLDTYIDLLRQRTPAQTRLIMRARFRNVLASRLAYLGLVAVLGVAILFRNYASGTFISAVLFLTLLFTLAILSLRMRARWLWQQDLTLPPADSPHTT